MGIFSLARVRQIRQKTLRRVLPWAVNKLLDLETDAASNRLLTSNAEKILVDNSVRQWAITHETARIDEEILYFGNILIRTHKMARINVWPFDATGKIFESVAYLPMISHLASRNKIKLFDSYHLRMERFRQPPGRYTGYGIEDLSLFTNVDFEQLPKPSHLTSHYILDGLAGDPDLTFIQREMIRVERDPLFQGIYRALGEKNLQDVRHIFDAELNGMYCFLTMDFKLIDAIKSQFGNSTIKKLKTKIISPQTFGENLGLRRVHPRLMSFHRVRFSADFDLTMPDGKRRPTRKRTVSQRKPNP